MTVANPDWRATEGHPGVRYRTADWALEGETIRRHFQDYRQWIAAHSDPGPSSTARVKEGLAMLDELIENLPGAYGPPRGDVLLWYEGETLVACGALRELAPATGELKRIYIRPAFRGDEFGKPFVRVLIGRSRELGYSRLRSYALGSMASALEFYEELGFRRIPPYWPHPAPSTVFFERDLAVQL